MLKLFLDAYLRLLQHDLFMSRNGLANLYEHLRGIRLQHSKTVTGSVQECTDALNYACAFYPRRILCLQRSSVLLGLLRRRGHNAQMMTGVQRMPFKAHAWVEISGVIVNDRLASRENFIVMEVC